MAYVKWGFILTFWTVFGGFLHYTLPQTDIVRIVNTYEERQELGDWTRIFWATPDDQSQTLISRDVQFIQTVRANGRPMVYRNEDTGWGWPPYFKFDTANLYTGPPTPSRPRLNRAGMRCATMAGATNSCRAFPTPSACGPSKARMCGSSPGSTS